MKNTKSYIILLIASLAILVACQKSDLGNMESVVDENLPDEVSKGMHLVYSDSGKTKFILDAPLIHKYTKDTNYTEFPQGVHGQFFSKEGEKTSDLVAGYCLKVNKDDEIIFRDSVRFENIKKEILISEEIYMVNDSIFSDTIVYIKTPAIIMEGLGFVSDKDLKNWKLLKPLGVYFHTDPKVKGKF